MSAGRVPVGGRNGIGPSTRPVTDADHVPVHHFHVTLGVGQASPTVGSVAADNTNRGAGRIAYAAC